MYAVIVSGGKQHRVELGTELTVDRIDAQPGQTLDFGEVLLVGGVDQPAIGRPHVVGASVSAEVVRHERGEKIVVFKYRPKARHRSKNGARSELTVLHITDIVHDGQSAAKLAEAARTERERLEAAEAQAAAKQAEADRALARSLAKGPAEPTATKAGGGTAGRSRRGSKQDTATATSPKAPAKPAKATAKPDKPGPPDDRPKRGSTGRTQAPPPPKPSRARPKKDQ